MNRAGREIFGIALSAVEKRWAYEQPREPRLNALIEATAVRAGLVIERERRLDVVRVDSKPLSMSVRVKANSINKMDNPDNTGSSKAS